MRLKNIPTDTLIHNIELKPGKGGQLARSAGTYGQLIGKDAEYAQIKLSSGEIRLVRVECKATVGMVSNPDQKNIKLGKAGRKRWLGIRPVVRGVAMNPLITLMVVVKEEHQVEETRFREKAFLQKVRKQEKIKELIS